MWLAPAALLLQTPCKVEEDEEETFTPLLPLPPLPREAASPWTAAPLRLRQP